MSNISKFINVLNTFLEVESFSPLVYKFPTALEPCDSCSLDKAVLSYIEDGYLLRNLFSSKAYSVAYMVSPWKNKSILIASCFGYVLDTTIKIDPSRTCSGHAFAIDPSRTCSGHAFAIVVEFITSRACKCLFPPYTHFTVDANIHNELFTIRCSYKGVKNFITLRNGNDHLSIELA